LSLKPIPLLIIGAGPSGLAAAIAHGKGAVILERNCEAGRKLLLSGSGQCNFTNNLSNEDFIRACRKAGAFLKKAVYAHDSSFFIEQLSKAGCNSLVREDGKVFPSSLKAEHVRDALLKTALANGAEIIYDTNVKQISRKKSTFLIETQSREYQAKQVLIACGGSSWQQTGSEGDGYTFAESLGHTINPIKPALASVETTQQDSFSHCAGSTLQDMKADFITKTGKHSDKADLLFTHRGLSGPLILNNSYLLEKGATIRLHLVPEAEEIVKQAIQKYPHKLAVNAFKVLPLTEALIVSILRYLGINPDIPVRDLNKKQINQFIGFLQAADFTVKQVESLETCMSTAGGVLLKEVNPATMESRLVPGLFFAGEVLDYSLPTGGFNIQTAFSTGFLAGESAL
jgi:predicted Rossmann fold flavoprotein